MYRILLIFTLFITFQSFTGYGKIGDPIDSYQGVNVYYNGRDFKNISGRNMTLDGYNLGLKFQCVEFVKRFYYKVYGHKMPDSYGHAKDFFDQDIEGYSGFNEERGLMQYKNVGYEPPQEGDILVYGPRPGNPFGHIAIVMEVTDDSVVLIQQNHGTKTRQKLKLVNYAGIYTVADYDIFGWLRMP